MACLVVGRSGNTHRFTCPVKFCSLAFGRLVALLQFPRELLRPHLCLLISGRSQAYSVLLRPKLVDELLLLCQLAQIRVKRVRALPEFASLHAGFFHAVDELIQQLHAFLAQLDEDAEIFLCHSDGPVVAEIS